MSILNTSYQTCIELSERVSWKLDDVVPPGSHLNLSLPFMPRAMFFGDQLTFLPEAERLKLNQILGNSYAYLFYFVEAFILTKVIEHARGEIYGDDDALRALLRFAEEEVKHQKLFLRFGSMFKQQFGTPCAVVESPQAVAEVILSKSPQAVLLITLHIELFTQAHYIDSMKDNRNVDPLFHSLFKYHWLEESQHAKLDVLELLKLRRHATDEQVQTAIDDYFDIVEAFAGLLSTQASLDVASLEAAAGRKYPDEERGVIESVQRRNYLHAFLYDGMTNSLFQEFIAEYYPAALPRIAKLGPQYA